MGTLGTDLVEGPARIRVGTASWADKSLVASKRFYPPGCSTPEKRLRYYATQFEMVEIDSPFYAMPMPANSEAWAARTPEDFVFNIKAFRLFTGHQTPPTALPRDILLAAGPPRGGRNYFYRDFPAELRDELWRRYFLALGPLQRAGKLRLVLAQFPHWIHNDREGRAHVEHVVSRLEGCTVATEFRHASWYGSPRATASTLDFETGLDTVHVTVDEPQGGPNSIPAVWESRRDDVQLVRLHGRNVESWNATAGAASGRFDYDYSQEELAKIAAEIRRLKAREVHVVFNNCFEDQGQRNGRQMRALLAQI